jgi:signal transduction histidine kinase
MAAKNSNDEKESARPCTDVQQLQQRVAELESNWKACAHLAEIGQMTTGVAHELTNPLSIILGFAQQLSRQADAQTSLSNSALTIEREALRCNRMVQNILNFARPSEAQKKMESIGTVLGNALTLVIPLARARGISVDHSIASNIPDIYLNASRIEQLIINVCANALDAMSSGGALSLKLRPKPDAGDPQSIELCVQDTGTGIPVNIREKVFEPFFTTKERGKGTGLGLSMAREIVVDHGGKIELFSREGYGTMVSIELPLGREAINPVLNRKPESSGSAQF